MAWRCEVINTFHADLQTGQRGEARVLSLLRQAGFKCEQRGGYWPEYDLIAAAKIEVKTDNRAIETGKLFIETRHNGRPSGLAITQADSHVFVIGHDVLFIATTKLRELAPRYPERIFKLPDCIKAGRLIPLSVLRQCAVL
jgi:hypothetical protein